MPDYEVVERHDAIDEDGNSYVVEKLRVEIEEGFGSGFETTLRLVEHWSLQDGERVVLLEGLRWRIPSTGVIIAASETEARG